MKKIFVVTSGRWDYGHLYPVMKEIQKYRDLQLEIVAPANHPVIPDEFKDGTVKYTNGIYSIDDYGRFFDEVKFIFTKYQADVVVVLGDRWEIHAAATAALLLNIPIAHIHGGEATRGCFDEELRNAITMMATWHFASTDEYGRNIMNMTHYNWREGQRIADCKVFVTGSPGVDYILRQPIIHRIQLEETFFIDFDKPFIIAVFHPVTKELQYARQHITNMLNALYRWGEQVVFVMPNIDPENGVIREQINKAASVALDKWQVCENIPHDLFLSLMCHAHMMVGNSSAGIIEAGYYNLPVVNIGTRQGGRVKAENVFDCGYGEEDIFRTIRSLDKMKEAFDSGAITISMPYGKGNAAQEIVKILDKELHPARTYNSSTCGTESGD